MVQIWTNPMLVSNWSAVACLPKSSLTESKHMTYIGGKLTGPFLDMIWSPKVRPKLVMVSCAVWLERPSGCNHFALERLILKNKDVMHSPLLTNYAFGIKTQAYSIFFRVQGCLDSLSLKLKKSLISTMGTLHHQ